MDSYITITFNQLTPDQARNLFASLNCDYSGPEPSIEAGGVEAGGFMSEEDVVETTTTVAKPTTASKAKRTKGKAEPAKTTTDDVRAALSKVMDTHGYEACSGVLKQFGVTRISELPEDKYAEFVAAAAKLLS